MPSYQTMDGELTNVKDPNRSVWYSAHCGYWTDDWDKVARKKIPVCPHCDCPGFYGSFSEWDHGVKKYEKDGHPQYSEFVDSRKEKCGVKAPFKLKFSYLEEYVKWLQEKEG